MRDLCIIGAGIVGSALAYEASAYHLDTVVLEKELDVALGASRANNAIIHAGYAAPAGSAMARYNVLSAKQMPELSRRLGFDYKECGSLLLSLDEADDAILQKFFEQGQLNGVEGLEFWDESCCAHKLPKLGRRIRKALFAPHSGVVNPWDYVLAFSQVALREGVDFCLDHEVLNIEKIDGGYRIRTNHETIESRYVINAAGPESGVMHELVTNEEVPIELNKSNYYLIEDKQVQAPDRILFECANLSGRGVLIAPTVGGRMLIGANSEIVKRRPGKRMPLETIREKVKVLMPELPEDYPVRQFTGYRLGLDGSDDFVLGFADEGFYDVAAICSPGLSAAPAMAQEIIQTIVKDCLKASRKQDWDGTRSPIRSCEQENLGSKDSLAQRIFRRDESVTPEEIREAIHQGLRVSALDWVAPRAGVKAGHCEGGLCGCKKK